MFNRYGLLFVAAISVYSQIVVAGGDGSEFDSLAAELAESSADTSTANVGEASNTGSNAVSKPQNRGSSAQTVNDSVTTSDVLNRKMKQLCPSRSNQAEALGLKLLKMCNW